MLPETVAPPSHLSDRPNVGWFHRYPARFALEAVMEMLSGVELSLIHI